MKTSRKTGKPAAKKNNGAAPSRSRRMEPIKGKVSKTVKADDDEDDHDPEIIEDENFKGFDDFYGDEDEDED